MTTTEECLTWFDWLLVGLLMLLAGLAVYEVTTWMPGITAIFPVLKG